MPWPTFCTASRGLHTRRPLRRVVDQRPRNRPYSPMVCAGAGIRLPHGRGEFLNSLSSVRTTMTFRSDGKATLRSPLPDEVAFESLASRLRPFTVDTDDLFYGKAFDALDRLLAAPEHDKFRRISQAVHQDWRTATDRTSRTRAYRISSEAAQHTDVDLAFSWLHGDLVLRASRGCSVISVVTCGVTRRDQLIRLARSTPHSKGVQVIVVGRVSVRDGCGHQRDRQQSAEHAHGYLHCRSPIVLELQPTTNASHLTCFSVVSWRKGPPHSVVLGARSRSSRVHPPSSSCSSESGGSPAASRKMFSARRGSSGRT